MMSKPTSKTQNVLIALVVLTCFVAIFCMYHEPTRTWLKCPAGPYNVSAEFCRRVFRMDTLNHTQTECTPTIHPTPPATTAKSEPDTIILIWMWPFGVPFDAGPCEQYNIEGCLITGDRSLYNKAHGVMIHHRDISGDFSNLPKEPRPVFQKWVWWNMESPTHSPLFPGLKEMFNLTSSYRLDSDVPVPYGILVPATEEQKKYTIPKKDKLVCWIVSNWNPNYRRTHFFNDFAQHITVDAFGGHFNRRINQGDYLNTVASCKFYLSFENSLHRDYISEKLFNPLMLGTVPVVMGPSRQNYEEHIPGDSFIHVDDFKTTKELADHLKSFEKNEEQYMNFFKWRENFVATQARFGLEHSCMTCAHIKRFKNYRVVKDLNVWWFV